MSEKAKKPATKKDAESVRDENRHAQKTIADAIKNAQRAIEQLQELDKLLISQKIEVDLAVAVERPSTHEDLEAAIEGCARGALIYFAEAAGAIAWLAR